MLKVFLFVALIFTTEAHASGFPEELLGSWRLAEVRCLKTNEPIEISELFKSDRYLFEPTGRMHRSLDSSKDCELRFNGHYHVNGNRIATIGKPKNCRFADGLSVTLGPAAKGEMEYKIEGERLRVIYHDDAPSQSCEGSNNTEVIYVRDLIS